MNTKLLRLIDWGKTHSGAVRRADGNCQDYGTQAFTICQTKLADALIHGKMLMIQGGDYTLCSGDKENCSRRCCKKERRKKDEDSSNL